MDEPPTDASFVGVSQSYRPTFRFRFVAISIAVCTFFVSILAPWACPAFVGLVTQIRKGLPDFARAPRTILAAANYESHRMIYNAFAASILLGCALTLTFLIVINWAVPRFWRWNIAAIMVLMCIYIPCGWIGPIRSDYTRQLVRSRWHAVRIILMYAVGLPIVFGFGIALIATFGW